MLTDTLLHILYTVARWRLGMLPVSIVAPPIVVGVLARHNPRLGLLSAPLVPLAIILGIVNLIFGTQICVGLIHDAGLKGEATVTGSFDTGNSFNDRRVMGHNVLIRTADGRTVDTSFADDDFNVYPPKNAVYYPRQGDVFNVSYLATHPADFIIIDNDDSPWARSLRCHELGLAEREASARQQFDPASVTFRKAHADALAAAQAAGCNRTDD